ncbi:MAG: tetratricopeptide repeat protein [Planctomycetota bacterium]
MAGASISHKVTRQLRERFSAVDAEKPVDPVRQLASEVARSLAENWEKGVHERAEHFFNSHPELRGNTEAALRVIYEEICLRMEAGETIDAAELHQRFPEYSQELEVVLAGHEFVESASAEPKWPVVGEVLGEFRINSEIARGGGGRVFLAEDLDLAGRRVVIKVTSRTGGEHLSLARLQHTHIMPLFSVREYPDRRCRLLCMPFLGGATLEGILAQLEILGEEHRSGKAILESVAKIGLDDREAHSRSNATLRFLRRAGYVDAVCWLGVCLGDALQYAHDQGLVHFDIKPSNILITSDAQPMLLDFHLARYPVRKNTRVETFGGTRAYMSPEQKSAFDAFRAGLPTPVDVGPASDVYSLGLVLVESLGGSVAFEEGNRVRWNWRWPEEISTGLSDILLRCLDPDPAKRYASAGEFAEDLRRHITQLPLKGVRNRSLAERWTKWRRRHPQVRMAVTLAVFVVVGAVSLGLATWQHHVQLLDQARAQWEDGRHFAEHGEYLDAIQSLRKADSLASRTLLGSSLRQDVGRDLQRFSRLAAEKDLITFVDSIRYLHGDASLETSVARRLSERCQQEWERHVLMDRTHSPVHWPPRLRESLVELALLWADFVLRAETDPSVARGEAARIIDRAGKELGPEPLLDWARRHYVFGATAARTDSATSRSSWEHFVSGRWLFVAGQYPDAEVEFAEAARLDPSDFWPWFYLGVTQSKLEQHANAVQSFTVAIALRPNSAECYCQRATSFAEMTDFKNARNDFNQALSLVPGLAPALFNRGVLSLKEHRWTDARRDFEQALSAGGNPARVHFHLALAAEGAGNLKLALQEAETSLKLDPDSRESADLAKKLKSLR